MLKKLLKALLVILALVAVGLICWVLSIYYQWQPWTGIAVFLGIAALILGFNFIKRVIYRSRQRITDALAKRKTTSAKQVKAPVDIAGQWQQAIRTLRQSTLRKRGDPLYVLPWYMVIGKQGSGKTTALTRARLASPIKEVNQSMLVDETHGCDWWYFDRAVVIDTSGRYVATDEDGAARDEWKKLLGLLARYRKKESLNGLVVTIAADMLLFKEHDALAEEGRLIRNRIDELMRLLDTKFPVYLVVTKCDVLYGLDEWASRLPAKTLDQALGYCAGEQGVTTAEFLDRAFGSVLERLRDLRLVLAERFSSVGAGLLLLPNEFERLRPGLERFFAGAFGENPYLETPLLRGMFFCSGMQRGGASSFVLKDSGLPEQTVMLSGTAHGIFLHDLFDRVIPEDRKLYKPLGQFSRWQRITRNVGYCAWLLAGLAVGIAFTLVFRYNYNTVSQLVAEYPAAGVVTGRLGADMDVLRRQLVAIRVLQERNGAWEARIMGFGDNVVDTQHKLEAKFAERFRKALLGKLDQQLAFSLNDASAPGSGESKSAYVQFVVRRLNLLRVRLDGGREDLAKLPAPAPAGSAVLRLATKVDDSEVSPGTAKSFDDMYLAYLAWSADPDALRHEYDTLKKWLKQLALSDENLNWLPDWANEQAGLEPVRLSDFWPVPATASADLTVGAAYTVKGQQAIQAFLKELDSAAADPHMMLAKKKSFEAWYRERRFDAWHLFVQNFDLGRDALTGEAGWKAMLPKMATLQSPYFMLLERVAAEFDAPEAGTAGLPEWARLARQLVAIKPVGRKITGFIDSASRASGIINSAGRQIIEDAIEAGAPRGKAKFDNFMDASKVYDTYYAELNKIWPEAQDGPGKSGKLAADFFAFSIDPTVKESALQASYGTLNKLKALMGGDRQNAQAVWSLVAAPLDFYVAYVEEQAACGLQKEWDAKVYFQTQGAATNMDLGELLYGAKGAVWTFANETAKAFLQRSATAYQPVEMLGNKLAFNGTFLQFINDAMQQKVAQVHDQKRADSDQKQQQLAQQQQQLDRQKEQTARQKSQQALQARQQEVQKQIRDVEQQIQVTKLAADQLRATVHPVTINALPTGINPSAKAIPFHTMLTMQCAPTPATLNNFNFPVIIAFNWSQATCGDTTLQIKIEGLTLVRKYAGPTGFARFIQEFYSGERVLTPQDFPTQKGRLEALDATAISVRYSFVGQETVLKQVERLEQLAQQDRDLLREKQRLEALRDKLEQLAQDQKQAELTNKQGELTDDKGSLQKKRDELAMPPQPVDVPVPQKIVACWDDAPRRNPLRGTPSAAPARPVPVKAAPAPTPKPPPPPPPAKTSSAAPGPYVVQIGLFPPSYAKRVIDKLEKDGIAVHSTELTGTRGQTLHRLRTGPYPDRQSATHAAGKLDDILGFPTLVVKSMPGGTN